MKKIKEEEEEMLFYMPKSLKTELKLLAAREGISMKDIMIQATKEHIKVHKPGNPQHLITSSMENDDFVGFPSMGISFKNKKAYINKHLQEDNRLNKLGNELWSHVLQWYQELQRL